MYEYQYVIGGSLSLLVSIYVAAKRPKSLALRFFCLFGLFMSVWEFSSFGYMTAPNSTSTASFFRIMILSSHLGFPLYLLTILNVVERKKIKRILVIMIPAVIQAALMVQSGYVQNYEFFLTEHGWAYRVIALDIPFITAGIIFVGYLAGIAAALLGLIRRTKLALLRRKYVVLVLSFVFFQVLGTTITNALRAIDVLPHIFQIGGVLQFLTFLSIWYALSLKEKEMPLSLMEPEDFSRIYSSFLTVYYNSTVASQLGEETFKFTDFIRESKIENRVSLKESKITFRETENLDLVWLINKNLSSFSEDSIDSETLDQYLRVLTAAYGKLGWRFEDVVKANLDFLKRSDLVYGISHGRFLQRIAEDASLEELDDLDACLKIYKRILMPVIDKIQANARFREKLSEYHATKAMRISDYGEISISGVRERLLRVPRDERVPTAIERFNSILSVAYEELLMDPNADVEGILEKLMLVLTLNKDRAMALGVYPTLLGTLATKIPRTQTHRLYSAFLEELVDERTRELEEAQDNLLKSQRLAVIGEAAAMVGHDLRNPLQAIVNTLYLAQKKTGSSSDNGLRELLDTISEQVEYMNKIVSDL